MVSILTATAVVPTWVKEVIKSYSQDNKIKELNVACTVEKDSTSAYTFKNGILRFHKVVTGTGTSLRQEILDFS